MRPWGAILAALVAVLPAAGGAAIVSHVYHEPRVFDPTAGEVATIHLRLSEPAAIRLHLYDGRDLRVRTLAGAEPLDAGDHEIVWDGRDQSGRPVPAEAYVYTIEVSGPNGARGTWDITDGSGGDPAAAVEAEWDADAGVVRYRLAAPCRVRLRAGIADGGPLLRTVLDWAPRAAGAHQEAWDGWDASRVLNVGGHPALALNAEAVTLPRNAILVGPPAAEPRFVELPDPRVSRPAPEHTRRFLGSPHQAMDGLRDFAVRLELQPGLALGDDGAAIVDGVVPVRLSVSGAHAAPLLAERFEVMFFVDGRFVFENEIGFLPTTWRWDSGTASRGVHYLSANLLGYNGHFGMATLKVHVGDQTTPEQR